MPECSLDFNPLDFNPPNFNPPDFNLPDFNLPDFNLPDFNLEEECISKVKAELKQVKADTRRELRHALKRAYAKVTLADMRGRFEHCGYSVTYPLPE